MICPECHRDVWLYDSNTWTCKLGHKTRVAPNPYSAITPPDVRVLSPWMVVGFLVGLNVVIDVLVSLVL